MEISTKTIKLKEAIDFANESGYKFAVYSKNKDNYDLISKEYNEDLISQDTDIVVNTIGGCIDCAKFYTADKQFMFILHNNCNVPHMIPIPVK